MTNSDKQPKSITGSGAPIPGASPAKPSNPPGMPKSGPSRPANAETTNKSKSK